MPVLPLVGSMMTVSRVDACPLARPPRSYAKPMRSLTLPAGLKYSSLRDELGAGLVGDAVEPQQRRVADQIRNGSGRS